MPTIEDFGAFKIVVYFEDENPPHVHVIAADFAAKVNIDTGEKMVGEVDRRVLKQVQTYIKENGAELLDRWNEYSA